MAEHWEKFEPERHSKYRKFSNPGDQLVGTVLEVNEGKFGREAVFALPDGSTTTLTCSSAQLRAWAEHAEVGDVWRIRFLAQGEGRDGQQGVKRFEFERKTGKAVQP